VDLGTGVVTTVAGNRHKAYRRMGPDAVSYPSLTREPLPVDAKGNVYVARTQRPRFARVDQQGKIRTIVGTGKAVWPAR